MAESQPQLPMDEASYLALDRSSEHKHELWNGEVYAMAGASLAHNRIVRNLVRRLSEALDGSRCEALPSDMRVRIPGGNYCYPDVTIVCGGTRVEGESDILLNPTTIIEVLSDSTAAFDRGAKFAGYREIAGLVEVVFVSQHEARIECYTRQADESWLMREYRNNAALVLGALPAPLPVALVYQDVDFGRDVDFEV